MEFPKEKEELGSKYILRNNGQNFYQFGERHKFSDVRSSVNLERVNAKKATPIHIRVNLLESQSWEESLESSQRKMTHYT